MRKFDLYWMSNRDWFTFTRNGPVVSPDAPQEAQDSYQRYLEQTKNYRILPSQEIYLLGNDGEFPNKTGNRKILLK